MSIFPVLPLPGTRVSRLVVTFAALFVGLFAMAAVAAHADTTDDADATAQAFKSGSHVYVSSSAGQTVDANTLKSKIGDDPVYIAVIAPNQTPKEVGNQILTTFNPDMTLVVISGTDANATSTTLCEGSAYKLLQQTRDKHQDDISKGELTTWLTDYVNEVRNAPTTGSASCADGTASGSGDAGSVLPWMIGIGVVGLGGGAYYVSRKRKQKEEALRGRRAEVTTLYDRLAGDVQHIDPKDNQVARQAIADASERYGSAGGILSSADSDGEYDAARRACIEGLIAARAARKALGLDFGADIPPIEAPRGEQLDRARQVQVGDETYEGHPEYAPGAPHYYGGGNGVPGGWYAFPFWETMLIGSMLGGGLFDGGGYDQGYDQGMEDAGDAGGDWGGGEDWG